MKSECAMEAHSWAKSSPWPDTKVLSCSVDLWSESPRYPVLTEPHLFGDCTTVHLHVHGSPGSTLVCRKPLCPSSLLGGGAQALGCTLYPQFTCAWCDSWYHSCLPGSQAMGSFIVLVLCLWWKEATCWKHVHGIYVKPHLFTLWNRR